MKTRSIRMALIVIIISRPTPVVWRMLVQPTAVPPVISTISYRPGQDASLLTCPRHTKYWWICSVFPFDWCNIAIDMCRFLSLLFRYIMQRRRNVVIHKWPTITMACTRKRREISTKASMMKTTITLFDLVKCGSNDTPSIVLSAKEVSDK